MKTLLPNQLRIHEAAVRLFAQSGTTQASVSELAQAAGVARGTIYNNVANRDALFEEVAVTVADEMHARVDASFRTIGDPAHRLARGVRLFVRRAHDEPDWGRFIVRFALTTASLSGMLSGQPARDLKSGLENRRYQFRAEQLTSVVASIAAATISAMSLVLDGEKTWREAGSDAAEFALRSIGVPIEDARALATTDLPPLPDAAD